MRKPAPHPTPTFTPAQGLSRGMRMELDRLCSKQALSWGCGWNSWGQREASADSEGPRSTFFLCLHLARHFHGPPQDPTQLKGGLATTAISSGPQEVLVRHLRDDPLGVHAHGPSSAPAEMQPAKGLRPLTALQIVLPPGGVMLKLTRLCIP